MKIYVSETNITYPEDSWFTINQFVIATKEYRDYVIANSADEYGLAYMDGDVIYAPDETVIEWSDFIELTTVQLAEYGIAYNINEYLVNEYTMICYDRIIVRLNEIYLNTCQYCSSDEAEELERWRNVLYSFLTGSKIHWCNNSRYMAQNLIEQLNKCNTICERITNTECKSCR